MGSRGAEVCVFALTLSTEGKVKQSRIGRLIKKRNDAVEALVKTLKQETQESKIRMAEESNIVIATDR